MLDNEGFANDSLSPVTAALSVTRDCKDRPSPRQMGREAMQPLVRIGGQMMCPLESPRERECNSIAVHTCSENSMCLLESLNYVVTKRERRDLSVRFFWPQP